MIAVDNQVLSEKIIKFIRDTVSKSGLQYITIGLSGGIDSAVTAELCVRALGYERVYAVMLPFGELSKEDVEDAQLAIEHLRIPTEHTVNIDITPGVDAITKTLPDIDDARKGNVMARVRMMYLFDHAKKTNSLVCGTENKTEYLLGYYTRFGDEASDLEPIRILYKTQVREMARFLQVPEKIVNRAPSANLWANQTDEKEFGFTYEDADQILHYHFEERLPEAMIVQRGVNPETVRKVLSWVAKKDFKHHLPYIFY